MNPADEHAADQDVIRDGLAMVEAAHRRDFEALGVLAANGDLRLMATFLARLADDLIGALAAWHDAPPGDLLAVLREEWVT